ncbi:MAG: hypothetical protein AAFR87_23340, partial [Bacteroidota bacterium]
LFSFHNTFGQNSGNYQLIIDGDTLSINLDEAVEYKGAKGKKMNILLREADIKTYVDDMVSFQYRKGNGVSNTVIEEGIEQCMIMKSTGSGFMVQKYKTLDPSALTRFMLAEITKESVSYGYEKTEEDFEHTLESGQTLKGVTATLTYRGEKEIYTVASYGEKDHGIMVVTMLLVEDFADGDKPMIDLFLNTLQILE